MIISQEDQVWRELFRKAFVETCLVVIGNGVVIRKRVAQLSKILGVFQMLSFVMTPYKESGMPWNYADLQFVWMGLGFISRIYYPTEVMGLPEIGITLVLFLYSALLFLQLFIFLRVLRVVRNGQLSTDHQAKIMRPLWIKAENILRYILLELAFIPTLVFLSEIVPAIEKTGFSVSIAHVYYATIVLLISIEIILDSILLQKLNWSLNSDNIVSMPRYVLSVRFAYLAMILVTNEITFKEHYFVYCSVLISIGLYCLIKFAYIQPYYSVNLNIFESYKAALILLAGFILLILTFNDVGSQSDYAVTSVYLLTIIPTMVMISDYIKKRRHAILNISSTDTNLNEFFLQLYHTSKNILTDSESNESQNLNCITDIEHLMRMHLSSSTKNGFIYLWTIYYKMNLGEWEGIHVLFSESRKIDNSWETMIYLQECKQEFMKCLRNNVDEWEAHSYMMFRQHLKALLKDDQRSCELLVDLLYELLSRNTDTSKLSAFVVKVISHTQNTKDYYYRLLKVFERNAQLLEHFAGYLDFVENTFASKDVYLRASKAREEQDVRSNFKEELVSFFNSNNMIMTISLEEKSLGKIIWVNNSTLLGYSDLELEKEDFTMLLPYKATDKQEVFFTGSKDIWATKENLYTNQKEFFIKRDGFMISVHTKKRLVNTDTNKLIMIMGLRINYDGLETAYLTEDGRFIYSMTSSMSTFLKDALKKTDEELWCFDILSQADLSEWKTGVKICGHFITINSNGETSYVEAITSEVFDRDSKHIKCIQLHGKSSGKDSEAIKIRETHEITANITRNTTPRITFEDTPYSYRSEMNQLSEDPATTVLSQQPFLDEPKESPSDLNENRPRKEEGGSALSNSSVEIQHKHLRDMRKKVFTRIGRYTKIIKVGVLIIYFFMLISCFVIFHFLSVTIYENHSGSKDVANLTQLTKSSIDLAYQSKMMYNHNKGISLNRTMEDIQTDILEVVSLIRDSAKNLRDSNDLNAIQNAMRNDIFPWWFYENGTFERRNDNLLNILKTMVTLGTDISARANVTENDADFMELYRNCPAEVFSSLNNTVSIFEQEYADKVYYFVGTINYTLIGGLLLLSVSQSAILVYFLIQLHKVRKNIWKIIENCPRTLIVSGIIKLKERLESVHGEENNLNEKYENRRSGFIYRNHYCQNILYVSAVFLILISSANIIFINYESLPKITQYLNDSTTYNKWTGLQCSYSMLTIFWVREIRLFPDIIKNQSFFTDPLEELNKVMDELIWAHKESLKSSSMSSEILDMYHDKSGNGYLVTGLHPALLEAIEASKSIAYQLLDPLSDADEALTMSVYVEGEVIKMINMMEDAIDIVFESSRDRIDTELSKLLMFLTLIQIVMLMFILLVIYPVIESMRSKMQEELQILMFLPRDDVHILLRLFSNI